MKKNIKTILNKIRLCRHLNTIKDPHLLSLNCQIKNSSLSHGVMVSHGASILNSSIARYTSIGRSTKIAHATIGSFCAISWDCTINAITHPINHLTISAFPYAPHVGAFVAERKQKHQIVTIGSDVWVGTNAIIMPGIEIGHGAIIGAGAIVTHSVPPYQIVVGNPAKILRSRFDHQTVESLLELEWWAWEEEKIKSNISFFQHPISRSDISSLKRL